MLLNNKIIPATVGRPVLFLSIFTLLFHLVSTRAREAGRPGQGSLPLERETLSCLPRALFLAGLPGLDARALTSDSRPARTAGGRFLLCPTASLLFIFLYSCNMPDRWVDCVDLPRPPNGRDVDD